jgi:hypothetical protein
MIVMMAAHKKSAQVFPISVRSTIFWSLLVEPASILCCLPYQFRPKSAFFRC